MGAFSIWHWLIVGAVVLILFGGRGKVSALLGDLGKGLKAFKNNIKDDDNKPEQGIEQDKTAPTHLNHQQAQDSDHAEAKVSTKTEKQNS